MTAILKAWKQADQSKENVQLVSTDPTFDIEINQVQNISPDTLQAFLAVIPQIDEKIQDFCKVNYEAGKFAFQNYVVELEWLSVESDHSILMGYWGAYVNIELRAIVEWKDEKWEIVDTYYQ